MTQIHVHAAPTADRDAPHIDLRAVATEPPGESIAHENEIIEHIAHEADHPEQPAAQSIDAQLRGLVDPNEIRRR